MRAIYISPAVFSKRMEQSSEIEKAANSKGIQENTLSGRRYSDIHRQHNLRAVWRFM